MIAKAKAISYGINDLRYITGESKHKKHPEKIYRVLDNLLPPGTGRYGDLELHAVDPFPTSADKEFHNQNRVESIA